VTHKNDGFIFLRGGQILKGWSYFQRGPSIIFLMGWPYFEKIYLKCISTEGPAQMLNFLNNKKFSGPPFFYGGDGRVGT